MDVVENTPRRIMNLSRVNFKFDKEKQDRKFVLQNDYSGGFATSIGPESDYNSVNFEAPAFQNKLASQQSKRRMKS